MAGEFEQGTRRIADRDVLMVGGVLLLGHARRELCSDAIIQSDRFEILDLQSIIDGGGRTR